MTNPAPSQAYPELFNRFGLKPIPMVFKDGFVTEAVNLYHEHSIMRLLAHIQFLEDVQREKEAEAKDAAWNNCDDPSRSS